MSSSDQDPSDAPINHMEIRCEKPTSEGDTCILNKIDINRMGDAYIKKEGGRQRPKEIRGTKGGKKRGRYADYSEKQVQTFLDKIVNESMKVPAAAKATGVARFTAYRYYKLLEQGKSEIELKKPKGGSSPALKEEHSAFLMD